MKLRLPERWYREPPGPTPDQRFQEGLAALLEIPTPHMWQKWDLTPGDVRRLFSR